MLLFNACYCAIFQYFICIVAVLAMRASASDVSLVTEKQTLETPIPIPIVPAHATEPVPVPVPSHAFYGLPSYANHYSTYGLFKS